MAEIVNRLIVKVKQEQINLRKQIDVLNLAIIYCKSKIEANSQFLRDVQKVREGE